MESGRDCAFSLYNYTSAVEGGGDKLLTLLFSCDYLIANSGTVLFRERQNQDHYIYSCEMVGEWFITIS